MNRLQRSLRRMRQLTESVARRNVKIHRSRPLYEYENDHQSTVRFLRSHGIEEDRARDELREALEELTEAVEAQSRGMGHDDGLWGDVTNAVLKARSALARTTGDEQ